MKSRPAPAQYLVDEKRKKVAGLIQTARVQKGWSQRELGERVFFSQNTIARIENLHFSPNADQLYLILDCLDLHLTINNEDI